MKPSYLIRSKYAWIGVAMILCGFGLKYLTAAMNLAAWIVPAGYFIALVGAGILFVGWVVWRAR